MLYQYAIMVAVLAWLTSVLTVGFGLYLNAIRDVKHMITVVGGLASALLWFVAAFGASGLVVVTDAGIAVSEPSAAATYLFAGFGIFMVVIAFVGTGKLVNVTDLAGRRSEI